MDSQGNIHELPFMKQLTIEQIQTAHRNGLKVYLDMKNNYGPLWEVVQGKEAHFTLPERFWPTFFKQYNKKVLEWAEIAERYGVELFSPMHEQGGVLGFEILQDRGSLSGYEKASEWGQEILPGIKERYHGKLIWNGGFGPLLTAELHERGHDELYINFTGYDYIGFTAYPASLPSKGPEGYREWVSQTIDLLSRWAERDGCDGVMATEMVLAFGLPPRSKGGYKDFVAYDMVFEAGEGRLSGYFPGFGSEPWDKEGFKHWYKERLP
jgi:hypothetical protein